MSIARTLADVVAAGNVLNDGTISASEVDGANTVTSSATAPASPAAGDLWVDLEDGSLNVYFDDGDTSQWMTVSGPKGADGTGFTGGSYNSSTGVVTFTSGDGLGFTTDDLRGADGTSVSPGKTIALAMIFG